MLGSVSNKRPTVKELVKYFKEWCNKYYDLNAEQIPVSGE